MVDGVFDSKLPASSVAFDSNFKLRCIYTMHHFVEIVNVPLLANYTIILFRIIGNQYNDYITLAIWMMIWFWAVMLVDDGVFVFTRFQPFYWLTLINSSILVLLDNNITITLHESSLHSIRRRRNILEAYSLQGILLNGIVVILFDLAIFLMKGMCVKFVIYLLIAFSFSLLYINVDIVYVQCNFLYQMLRWQ